jgi:hypothetical protein
MTSPGKATDSLPVYMFPYDMGPSICAYGTMLLWVGRVSVFTGGWVSPEVIPNFLAVARRAEESSSSLVPVFRLAIHYHRLAGEQLIAESKGLNALKPYLPHIILVSPATQAMLEGWEPHHDPCLFIAAKMLEHTQILNVAANGLIWRVHELFLETDRQADKVLAILDARAQQLGGPPALLAECVLHRLASFRVATGHVATNSGESLAIWQSIGASLADEADIEGREERIAQLSFTIFEAAVAGHVPMLEQAHAERFADILQAHGNSLTAARRKCAAHARQLIAECPTKATFNSALKEVLNDLHDEVAATLKIDRKTYRGVIDKVTESPGFWASVAGLVGGAVGALPPVVPAAAAVTALSILGASALKASRERKKALAESPWSFVYHLA